MKDSALVGAAESAPVQSKDNSPSGSTKPPKGSKGTAFEQVSYSNTDRNPNHTGPQFKHEIGGK